MRIITYTKSDGTTRACDAKCYNATGPVCTCVCGGKNHGVRLVTAINQSYDWLKPDALDNPGPAYKLMPALQLPLFGDTPRRSHSGDPSASRPQSPLSDANL